MIVRAAPAAVESVVGRWGTVEAVSAQTCRLRMVVDDLSWPMMVLASVGADFEVETPSELGDRVRQVSTQFGRATA